MQRKCLQAVLINSIGGCCGGGGSDMSGHSDEGMLNSLAGKCVLVVEADQALARAVSEDLKRHGVEVLGPAPTIHYARLIIGKRRLDGAIVDVKELGLEVLQLVETLMGYGVPIAFVIARGKEAMAARYRSIETLTRPLNFEQLRRKIAGFRPQAPVRPMPTPIGYRTARSSRVASAPTRTPVEDKWSKLLLKAMKMSRESVGLPEAEQDFDQASPPLWPSGE